jgi:hypothetical protein
MEKRAQTRPAQEPANAPAPAVVAQAVATVLGRVERPLVPLVHIVPPLFVAGQPLTIELSLLSRQAPVTAVRLCYRHVHQAQAYQSVEMQAEGNRYRAAIPGAYTNLPYPLEYYFELRNDTGGSSTPNSALGTPRQAWLYPGFDTTLTNQPYFVVRQA